MTLLGLVVTQVFWIKKSYNVAERDFDNNVNSSLNDVIGFLKSKDVIFLLDKSNRNSRYVSFNTSSFDSISTNTNWVSHSIDMNTTIDSENKDEVSIKIIKKKTNNGEEVSVTVDTIIDPQAFYINEGIEPPEFDQKNDGDINNFIQEIIVQYTSEENPLESRLNNINLDSIISDKLLIHGIESKFLYGITDEDKDGFLKEFSTLNFLNPAKTKYSTDLFQNDAFSNTNQLVVQFDDKSQYIFDQMKMILVIIIALTLLLLFTFWMTLKIIWKQKRIDQMKNDFINNMTHEFKTPVATIGLAIDSMTHDKNISDEIQIRKFGAIIRNENSRINNQLERVLEITKFSDVSMKIDCVDVDIKSSIQKSIDILSLQLENSEAQLSFESCDNLKVKADASLLETVWINLIDNAIKYAEGIAIIAIKCDTDNDNITVEFSDQGIGMTAETQARIFDNFYRESHGNIHNVKGFGLGMSYVKKIIDLHNGEISIESKLNEGSIIKILFPSPQPLVR